MATTKAANIQDGSIVTAPGRNKKNVAGIQGKWWGGKSIGRLTIPLLVFAIWLPMLSQAVQAQSTAASAASSKNKSAKQPAATAAAAPAGATAKCKDGTYSTSQNRSGTCSHHGGVADWLQGPPAGATAKCKDGSYWTSKARSGACSKHGGVVEWLQK